MITIKAESTGKSTSITSVKEQVEVIVNIVSWPAALREAADQVDSLQKSGFIVRDLRTYFNEKHDEVVYRSPKLPKEFS